jgi:hypothetical protein
VSGFVKRFVLAALAAKVLRLAHRRGHHPVVGSLLRAVDRRLGRRHGHYGHYGYGPGYGHGHGYGCGHGYGHGHGHGYGRRGRRGHFRRRYW